jgi:hypothetical protein
MPTHSLIPLPPIEQPGQVRPYTNWPTLDVLPSNLTEPWEGRERIPDGGSRGGASALQRFTLRTGTAAFKGLLLGVLVWGLVFGIVPMVVAGLASGQVSSGQLLGELLLLLGAALLAGFDIGLLLLGIIGCVQALSAAPLGPLAAVRLIFIVVLARMFWEWLLALAARR